MDKRRATVERIRPVAGYCGGTRRSYATDLRLFSAWCHEANLTLFSVRRAHLELFGRWMEETGSRPRPWSPSASDHRRGRR